MISSDTRQLIEDLMMELRPPLMNAARRLPPDEHRFRPQVVSLLVQIERYYELPRTIYTRQERREMIEGSISRW